MKWQHESRIASKNSWMNWSERRWITCSKNAISVCWVTASSRIELTASVKSEPSVFDSRRLLNALERLPKARTYWVGFSGGADSTALLQAMWEAREQLPAP